MTPLAARAVARAQVRRQVAVIVPSRTPGRLARSLVLACRPTGAGGRPAAVGVAVVAQPRAGATPAKRTMRLLPLSATSRPPAQSISRPRGTASWPAPVPGVPSVWAIVPSAARRRRRPLLASATQTPPSLVAASPAGIDGSPPAGRGIGQVASSLPVAS